MVLTKERKCELKHRRVMFISLLLALLIIFAAMPPLTQASSINNFKYSHTNSSGNWVFTWDTYQGKHKVDKFQFKGGGWQKVYISVNLKSVSSSGGTTRVVIGPIYYGPGHALQFRVRLEIGDDVYTPWATTSHTFS